MCRIETAIWAVALESASHGRADDRVALQGEDAGHDPQQDAYDRAHPPCAISAGVGAGAARVTGSEGVAAAWGHNRIITERREERT